MLLTSVETTVEAIQNYKDQKWISDIIPHQLRTMISEETAGPETIAHMALSDLSAGNLEYNEVADLKVLFFILSERLNVPELENELYPSIRQLHSRAFAHF